MIDKAIQDRGDETQGMVGEKDEFVRKDGVAVITGNHPAPVPALPATPAQIYSNQ